MSIKQKTEMNCMVRKKETKSMQLRPLAKYSVKLLHVTVVRN